MRTAAVLPVKRFARAKQRLGASVAEPTAPGAGRGDGRRRAGRARPDAGAIERTIVVHDESAVAGPALGLGAIVVADEAEQGQSAAAALGAIARRSRRASSACCAYPATAPRSTPRAEELLGDR